MKHLIVLLIMGFAVINCKAQLLGVDLIFNGNFEQHSQCPNSDGDLWKADGWGTGTWNTPDYFNECNQFTQGTGQNYDVPSNKFGYQNAHSGNGYGGLCIWHFQELREYAADTLIDTLKPGKEYQLDFYTSLADSSQVFAFNFGVYLSDTNSQYFPWYQSLDSIYTPQIEWDSSDADFTDTTNWIHLTKNYLAHGGEKYIMLGNFRNNEHTDTSKFGIHSNYYYGSYFYLDDVSLREVIPESASPPITNNNCIFYPIPADDNLNFNCDDLKSINDVESVTVVNVLGQKVYEMKNPSEPYVNTEALPDGIYFLSISKHDSSEIKQQFIIMHNKF